MAFNGLSCGEDWGAAFGERLGDFGSAAGLRDGLVSEFDYDPSAPKQRREPRFARRAPSPLLPPWGFNSFSTAALPKITNEKQCCHRRFLSSVKV